MNLLGLTRFTEDLDLFVAPTEENIEGQPVWRTLGVQKYRSVEELDAQVQRWQQEHLDRRRLGVP